MVELKLTDVKINMLESPKILAVADIELSGCIIIKGFTIMEKDGKRFVNNPATKAGEKVYIKTVEITNKNVKEIIDGAILKKYDKVLNYKEKPGIEFTM